MLRSIPSDAVRDALGLQAGDRVRYVILDEGVLMMPVRPTSRLFGSLKYDGPAVSMEDMEREIAVGATLSPEDLQRQPQ